MRTLDAFPSSWHHNAADNLSWDSYAHSVSQNTSRWRMLWKLIRLPSQGLRVI